MVPFDQASYLSKVRRLRALAEVALEAYLINVRTIEFIKLSANAIFRITDRRDRAYQLRINPLISHHQQAALEEIKWLNHIRKNTNIRVPSLIKNQNGQYVSKCFHPLMSASRLCTLFEWLPGTTRWKSINEDYAFHLGALIALIQKSGKNLKFKHRNYWDADSLVGTTKARFYNVEELTDISSSDQKAITQARRAVHHKLKQYQKMHPDKCGLIHGDMQPNNILVSKEAYSIIDFDDCGMGLYGVDIGTALCAFEHIAEANKRKSFQSLQESLLDGYVEHMPLKAQDIDLIPYFMLSIKLMTIAWLEIRRDNPQVRQYYRTAINRVIKSFNLI